jgi:hypothetical protein
MHEFIARRGDDLFPGRSKLRPTALWLAAHTDGGDYVFQRAAHGVYSVESLSFLYWRSWQPLPRPTTCSTAPTIRFRWATKPSQSALLH